MHNYKLCKYVHNHRLLIKYQEQDIAPYLSFFMLKLLDGVITKDICYFGSLLDKERVWEHRLYCKR